LENPSHPRRLIGLKQVQGLVPFSRSTIYSKIRSGDFPPPIKISANRIAWDSGAIENWIASKMEVA
jgi:prophage regulatory protein